jgi:hypothetical protein
MSEPQLYRLWDGDEDFGTATEKAARMWLEVALKYNPDAHIEPVDANAPVFLKQPASACCGAPISLAGGARFGTHYFVCSQCRQACDAAS